MADVIDQHRVIWVLKGARAGDTAQALALAQRLGGQVVEKQLLFNAWHQLPNWLLGPRVSHLTPEARQLIVPPWPDLLIATGRRTAPVSAWIRARSDGKTKTVQLGRPRMALSHFDLVVTTPQYGMATAPNCVEIPMPIHRGISQNHDVVPWINLPRPWLLAVVGGGKYPQQLGARQLAGYAFSLNAHIKKSGGSIVVLDAPRTRQGDVKTVADQLTSPHWVCDGRMSTAAYVTALHTCDALAVTSDSVSIISDMLAMRKPTWVYPLPRSAFAVTWNARQGVGAALSRSGLLQPPRDVTAFFRTLIEKGHVGNLATGKPPTVAYDDDTAIAAVIARINGL